MKVYVVGINFSKYSLLKKMIDHLTREYEADCEVVDWLAKKYVNPEQYSNGDFYIYVEVERIFDSGIYMQILPGEAKSSIASKFAEANDLLKSFNSDCNEKDTVEDDIPFEEGNIKNDIIERSIVEIDTSLIVSGTISTDLAEEYIYIKKYTGKKSSLTGITVTINGKDHYISKEDFMELRELDELLTKNNMVLKEIIVE